MSDDFVLQRVKEIYEQKILTKQVLTEEELMFFGREVIRLKDNGIIEDEQYSNYMLGTILNPTAAQFLSSEDFADVIGSMRELRGNSEVRYTGDGHNFTNYERTLYHLLNRTEILLNDKDRARLISEVADSSYTFYYLSNPEISSELKEQLLHAIQEQKYATRKDYFRILNRMSIRSENSISPDVLYQLLYMARDYRSEEKKTKPYNDYTLLVRNVMEQEYDRIVLEADCKMTLLLHLNDEEYLEEIFRGESKVNLEYWGLVGLVDKKFERMRKSSVDDNFFKEKKEFYLKYIKGEEYIFSTRDKLKFLGEIGDPILYREYLESNDDLGVDEQAICLREIGNPQYTREFMERQSGEWCMRLKYAYIRLCGTKEEKAKMNEQIIEITDISKLTLEQLENLPEDTMIRVAGKGTAQEQTMIYSKSKYTEILQKIDEMFGDIEPAIVGDKQSELETFLEVYKRMSGIVYDYYANEKDGKKNKKLQTTCRNLEGGILEGKCVCAGYAEILRNILAQKRIDAQYISGMDSCQPEYGHAWNQVKIGGVWFNVDITWDRNLLAERLQRGEAIGIEWLRTDEQFANHSEFEGKPNFEKKCTIPIETLLAPEPQSLGMQVADLLQENGITRTEFANQYRQIQDMQNDLNRQEEYEQQQGVEM